MRHAIFYLALSLLVFGCNDTKKEAKTETKSETVESTSIQASEIGKNNYAVVWNWTTTDEQLVSDNVQTISNELTSLWKKGIVENTYYNSDSKVDKLSYFPNISFSLKAESYESAEVILNKLTIVKKGIATYKLYPIGTLWLDRKYKTIHENGMTKSFVTVWTTTGIPTDELTQVQNDKMLELWKSGKVENVYFDIEGTQKANNETDFVFYANANSEADAKAICESLPFFKDNIATYKIHEVGVFWMGKYEQN
ncbi:hypothetical protein ATE84_5195 [Aquimarina sp. MAR_2010_214]|uniref:hypothetical protein n=1 Tax=Aquimarina sp. MAR_2010_214 TaxID=1250026 RepID=UPI000C70997A|nr:hypothetical protein [Aquimarina sp. MAR_2010_214]PKV53061.1 hypothetical protein ATE84_5195 [Aquimarina sp. MAR_2010_214]